MPLVIIAGVVFIHVAFVLYTIFIIKEHKYRRATKGVARFILAAVIFDVTATACMMIGAEETYFTLHGILGYTALTVMIIDAVFIWKHKLKYGAEVPFSDTLNRNTKLGYILWLVAFTTGMLMAYV
jgi:EamA domain-containing membrane protein RarD